MTPRELFRMVALGVLVGAGSAAAQPFPVLQGDPVDGLGRALPVLPGVPLITANQDGDFKPPVIDTNTIGDVDLVIRAGHLTPGASMPPPALVPPVAAAGGSRFPGGIDIPFTVIASDGDPLVPGGHPLLGPELNGIPVIVMAWADLDRDGFIGPTTADPAGAGDDARELQEALFPVGVRVAYFTNGIAQGVIAADVGAPASDGGLPVVLTAAAYVGQFDPGFFAGTVPDGPAIATLLPFFPRLDPERVIDTDGSAGPGLPDGRLALEVAPEFDPPVNHPLLGTPFALPTDGSSVTIDRAIVVGATASSVRFVEPSTTAGLTGNEPRLPLWPGAGGSLLRPRSDVVLIDDGPGGGIVLDLVPIDVLGSVTDPASPMSVDLVAGPGLAITAPDTDADTTRETVEFADAAAVAVSIDDAGGVNDSGAETSLALEVGGARVGALRVTFTPGTGGGGNAPVVETVGLLEQPSAVALACPRPKTIVATITDLDGDANGATAVVEQNGIALAEVELSPAAAPAGTWTAPLPVPPDLAIGTATVTVVARDAAGHSSAPQATDISVSESMPPIISDLVVSPSPLPALSRARVVVSARIDGDCDVHRVKAQWWTGTRNKRIARLNDLGRKGDTAAGDGTYSGRGRIRVPAGAPIDVRVTATNRFGDEASVVLSVPVAP